MTLPSSAGGRTTEQLGYFESDFDGLVEWLSAGLGSEWHLTHPGWVTMSDAVTDLMPAPVLSRYACVALGDWVVVLNNSPLGTDVGVLPSYAARELHCRAIRAVSVGDDKEFPARLVEIFGPEGTPPLAIVRSIVAARDGDRWVFETSGEPLPFEDLESYARPIKSRRLTTDMVVGYLRALGVPVDSEPDWRSAVVIEKVLGSGIET